MRTWKTHKDKQGRITEEWLESSRHEIPHYLEEELAVVGLVSITKRWGDGSQTTYTHLEYECDLCGQYGHGNWHCPEADEDDAIDDRSSTPGDLLR